MKIGGVHIMLNHVGFTGTQRGITSAQRVSLARMLDYITLKDISLKTLHHGDCIGADAEAAAIAKKLGYQIVAHPPINAAKRALYESHLTMPAKEYLVRNADIVAASEIMIACPGESQEVLRSGTWATIRKARKAGVALCIIYPNGEILRS